MKNITYAFITHCTHHEFSDTTSHLPQHHDTFPVVLPGILSTTFLLRYFHRLTLHRRPCSPSVSIHACRAAGEVLEGGQPHVETQASRVLPRRSFGYGVSVRGPRVAGDLVPPSWRCRGLGSAAGIHVGLMD